MAVEWVCTLDARFNDLIIKLYTQAINFAILQSIIHGMAGVSLTFLTSFGNLKSELLLSRSYQFSHLFCLSLTYFAYLLLTGSEFFMFYFQKRLCLAWLHKYSIQRQILKYYTVLLYISFLTKMLYTYTLNLKRKKSITSNTQNSRLYIFLFNQK